MKKAFRCRICRAMVNRRAMGRHLMAHQAAACKAIRSSMSSLRAGFAVNGVIIAEPDVAEELQSLKVAIALIKNPLPFR